MAKENRFVSAIKRVPFIAKALDSYSGLLRGSQKAPNNIPIVQNNAHNLNRYTVPIALNRIKQDTDTWRAAIVKMEDPYFPMRVDVQVLYVDKVLEGHTYACMTRRRNLTLLKDFKIGTRNDEGKYTENVEATKLINNRQWFRELISHIIDAQFYGYSLVQLGDLSIVNKDYSFKNLTIVKRWHISPDRFQLVRVPQQFWGLNFMDPKEKDDKGESFYDWSVYIPTPSDNGASICGYGLLYNVALYGIYLRNNLSDNATFNELFSMPLRHIKTTSEYGSEDYNMLERFMGEQASRPYLITGAQEELEYVESKSGTGFQSYENLEMRCQAMISKILLGHADALDSKSTALGGGTGGKKTIDEDNTPEGKALLEIEKTQDDFVLNVLNDTVKAKLIKLKFPIPADCCFYTTNDKEEFELRKKKDAANLVTATVWQTAKQGGLKLSAKAFTEITGIEAEEVTEPAPNPNSGFKFGAYKEFSALVKKKLDVMYKHTHPHGKA